MKGSLGAQLFSIVVSAWSIGHEFELCLHRGRLFTSHSWGAALLQTLHTREILHASATIIYIS